MHELFPQSDLRLIDRNDRNFGEDGGVLVAIDEHTRLRVIHKLTTAISVVLAYFNMDTNTPLTFLFKTPPATSDYRFVLVRWLFCFEFQMEPI